MKASRFSRLWLALSLSFCLNSRAGACFVETESVPVGRLVHQAEAYMRQHPDDAGARYTVARTHYLAFHMGRSRLPAWPGAEGKPPQVASAWLNRPGEASPGGDLSAKEMLLHAASSAQRFREAIQLAPKNGLYRLGLASLEEEYVLWRAKVKPGPLPEALTGITLATAWKEYARALEVAYVEERKLTELPMLQGLDDITSYEAAQGLLRLAKGLAAELSGSERREVEHARAAVKYLRTLKDSGAITPIVFSFHLVTHLEELLEPGKTVDFDLRGYGLRERWPWVSPELGLLVWDPAHTGAIRSARQLFGGYTFEIFRATGYEALAALDDNGDGILTGAELEGIGVWFNWSGDGLSAPEQVFTVQQLGVVAIAVAADGFDSIHPTNARGITLRDGRTLPSWDWIVRPAGAEEPHGVRSPEVTIPPCPP